MKERKTNYNSFRTDEKWSRVNRESKSLIEEYELELKSNNKSRGTILQYLNDIKIFACYIYDELENIPFYEVTRKQVRNFVIYLQDLGKSPARINRILSSLRTMYDFAINDDEYEEDYETNPVSKIKGLKKEKVRTISFLSMNDINIIYNRLIKDKEYQQALLLALLIDSAGRKNEIAQIRKDSIKEDGCFTNEVVGKGGKSFKLMYHKMTKDVYKLYIEQRGEDNCSSLWYRINNRGEVKEISPNTLYDWVKKWNKLYLSETGKKTDFNIHSFRHTALELLSTGEHYLCDLLGVTQFSLDTLKALAHHNDMATTSAYLKEKSEETLMKAFYLE